MSGKNFRYGLILFIIIAVVLCVILALRIKNTGIEQKQLETEKTTQKELEKELEVEIETVSVEDDDAVSELHEALMLALSDTEDNMEDMITGLSKSADLGNSDAMYFLGELYFQGIGVEANLETASAYFQQACACGNRKAMLIYAKMLFMGDGGQQNYDESASYFYTISKDDGEASYILGVMSNLGIGVPRSAERARKYIDQSAEAGYVKAVDYRSKIADIEGNTAGTKDFELKAKKVQYLDYGTEYEDLTERIEQYYNIIKSTEKYQAFEDEMTGLLDVDMDGVCTTTLFGNNGYLFQQKNKELYPLHYKTDTHANMVGSLFMLSDLFTVCYDVDIAVDLDKFDIHFQDFKGDLGVMANCTDRYASDKVYYYPDRAVSDEEKINSSMMLIGDSFSEFMNIEANYYLSGGVDHRVVTEYDSDYHNATQAGFDGMNQSMKPEYVVWECVERHLDRLVPKGEKNK